MRVRHVYPDGMIQMVCVLRVTMRCVARVFRRRGPYRCLDSRTWSRAMLKRPLSLENCVTQKYSAHCEVTDDGDGALHPLCLCMHNLFSHLEQNPIIHANISQKLKNTNISFQIQCYNFKTYLYK